MLDEKLFSNGDVYFGNLKGILPHGIGKYTWSDGTVYEGDWEEGKMTGKGQILWQSGASYDGDFSGGYLHGFGTFIGNDGSTYKGEWRMNVQHGLGRKQYSNSDIYDGMWKEGVHEGCGRYIWKTGNSYVGNWKAGKMCDRGIMTWTNGDIFDGFWSNGFRHGSGFYRFADGSCYFGTWTRNLKDGQGTFYPSGINHPSLVNWYPLIEYDENRKSFVFHSSSANLDNLWTRKRRFHRCLCKKKSINGFLKNSGRICHRPMTLEDDSLLRDIAEEFSSHHASQHMVSKASKESQSEVLTEDNISTVVYERQYMQGVLIKEKLRNFMQRSTQPSKFQVKEGKKSCVDVYKGHRSYYLMLNLQVGIRYTVGKITPVPIREVRSSDFGDRARISMYFPRKGSQFTPSHYSIDFHWKDYCPMVFRNLREMFKIDAADYMMSICGDDGLRELSSPGKSGSIFYLSHDDKFVIKTLKRSELKVLLKMLPKYYKHVGEHENTLITKFFGVHRITLKGGQKVRFVVMGNMFRTELRIHRRYDLKGSSKGRYTNKDDIDENTTLKDLDISYEFYMDKSLRDSLFRQISHDCSFLESQQIIDYSLLLGVHFRVPDHLLECPDSVDSPERLPSNDVGTTSQGEAVVPPKRLLLVTHEPTSVNTAPGPHSRGGSLRAFSVGDREVDLLVPGTGRLRVQLGVNMPAQANRKVLEDGTDSMEVELYEVYDVVLYLGIIDILQEYNMKKKVEHAYKSMQFDPLSISSVEPRLYSQRFITFLETVFPSEP